MTRKLLLTALLAAAAAAPLAAQSAVTPEALEEWYTATRRTAPGTWGIVVADQAGEIVWSVNAWEPMTPASTVKVLTTGFARTVLGGDARRATRVIGNGGVDPMTGTWEGSWALELNGDPTLERGGRSGPTLESLAGQLAAIGVRRLIGPLALTTTAGAASASYPAAWDARHRGRYFAPLVGPVTLNENLVAFTVSPGSKVGMEPVITADQPRGASQLVKMQAKTVAGRRSNLAVRRDGSGWAVTGTIGVTAPARSFSNTAHDPAAVVEAAWSQALGSKGITWSRDIAVFSAPDALRNARVLAEVASQPFDSIAHEINTRSVNIGAELMLLWGGGVDRASSRLEQHVKAVTGVAEGVKLVDGSGLSDHDRVAPAVFTRYLANFPRTAAGKDFPLLLPANGSGTLRSLRDGLPGAGVVRAKTGSLNQVATVVGYVGTARGTMLVAAMYHGTRTTAAREAQWQLFRTLGADGIAILPSDGDVTTPVYGSKATDGQ